MTKQYKNLSFPIKYVRTYIYTEFNLMEFQLKKLIKTLRNYQIYKKF